MKKIRHLTAAVALLATNAAHAQAEDTVASPTVEAVTASTHFDISGEACHRRMNQIQEISRNDYKPSIQLWATVRAYDGKPKVFDVPLEEWSDSMVEEFQHALDGCMTTYADKQLWDRALGTNVLENFPTFIAATRAQVAVAEKFSAPATSSSGAVASCMDLLQYEGQRVGREMVLSPTANVFGKELANYDDKDFAFLDEKLEQCSKILEGIAAADGADRSIEILRLNALRKAVATEWPNASRSAGVMRATNATDEAAHAIQKQETDRRTKNPTFFDSLTSYMYGAGMLGIMMCGGLMGKPDKRFKSGYKDNWRIPGWMKVVGSTSFGLIGLAVMLSWLVGR